MSQPEKKHPSNNHDGLAILRESATPDIYHKNGFRILELPVDVGAKEINSRTRLVEMAFRQHAELNSQPNNEAQDSEPSSTSEAVVLPPGRGRYFPLTPAPDQFAIRDAMQRLGDPERRLVDEFFWFWPHSQGESAKDAALVNLRGDKNKEAEGIWLEQESEQSESSVSTHNLAVLYHFMALEWENYNRNGELAEEDKDNIEKLWKRAYRRWSMLFNEEGFWSRFNARIREMEDPRLTAETASRIRRSLPAALLSISARLALQAVECGQGHLFKETFTLSAPNAKTVCLAGDFNGWDKSHQLQKTADGVWRIIKDLAPGRYEYRFVVDGSWHDDPQSSTAANNPHGTKNAVRFVGRAFRLADSIRNSGFSEADIKEGLRLAVEPVRNRIKTLCKAAEDSIVADPIHADKTCRHLFDSTSPLLNGLDCLLPAGNPTRDLAHDDVAEQALKCQVAFAKKTNNWKISAELLEVAANVAASESVIKTLKENVENVKKNASNNDDFCGEGYYDLPATVLEELEAARKHADSQDFDGAVSRIEKLVNGGRSVVVEPSHLLLINKALAYCLGFRAIKRINESMAEWNAHKPSTITDIQKRADSIDQTSWMCAGREQIPQYVNCRCMACGNMITGRYNVIKWTFKDKPVSLIICDLCGDRHRREIDSARSKIKGAIKQSAQDFVDAGQLDSANKFVQGQIERVRKMCSDSEIPFPSPSRQSKKSAKQQAAPPKPRPETAASGTSVRMAECANAKKTLYWGIASIFCFLAAIPAIVLGHKALREIKQSNGNLGGRSKARTGLVLGYIVILIMLSVALAGVWYFGVEKPAQEEKAKESAAALAKQQAAIQKAAEDKAKVDAETARLAEELRKAEEAQRHEEEARKAKEALITAEVQRAEDEIHRLEENSHKAEDTRKAEEEMSIEKRANSSTTTYKDQGYLIAHIITIKEGQENMIIGRQDNGDYFKATAQGWDRLGTDDLNHLQKSVEYLGTIKVEHPLLWLINSESLQNKDFNNNYENLLNNTRLALFGNTTNSVIGTLSDTNIPGQKILDATGHVDPLKLATFNIEEVKKKAAINAPIMYRQGVLDGNDPAALKTLAEQGDADAALRLGLLYEAAKGVNQDFVTAISWYRKAADAGNPDAQNNLGWMYEKGFGAEKDNNEARNWYHKAADAGSPEGQKNWARMMETNSMGRPQQDTTTNDATIHEAATPATITESDAKTTNTMICDAARDGDLEKIKTLLKDHPDLVFSKDDNGVTPLHYAAAMGRENIVELLLADRADVNAKSNNGMTPLHAAAAMGHKDVVELLREHGGQE